MFVSGSGQNVRVLVVDDSAFMRKVIRDILEQDGSIKVIDTAKNGAEAIEKARALNPDVITMDVEMPVMDGVTCLKELLRDKFVPVIMLSSHTREGADATISSLENGAVDFITKPTNIFNMSSNEVKKELVEKILMAKSVKGRSLKESASRPLPVITETARKVTKQPSSKIKYFVAIGTSTGGPKALQEVIPFIPADVPAAYLVVQHMPPGFTKSLAERLNNMSEVTVKEAEDLEVVKAGHVYIAPGDYHMLLEKTGPNDMRIRLSQTPPVGGHRPAVNMMMDSLSDTGFTNLVGVIMTGMGGDGAEGIKKIKAINKGYIITQDEKTCVVYGMPKVAFQTGAVDKVVPLREITKEIVNYVGV